MHIALTIVEVVLDTKLEVKLRIRTSVSLFPSCCHDPEYEFVALEKSIGDSDERSPTSLAEDTFDSSTNSTALVFKTNTTTIMTVSTNTNANLVGNWTANNFTGSDKRIKKDIVDIPSYKALEVVKKMQGVRYNLKEKNDQGEFPEYHKDKPKNGLKKIGFIGLGNMGLPMANNILKAGIEVNAFDLSEKALNQAENLGMSIKQNSESVLEDIDALITMLPNGSSVEKIFLDDNLLKGINKQTLIIESSTISPEISKKVSKMAKNYGISMLDAPVSGGVKGAELGNLTFMVGGSEADLEKGSSLFKIMGDKIFYAGESGSGQIAKLCNNMLLAVHMCGTAETLALGVNNGLDPVILSEIMKNSSGGNWSLEKYNPYPGVMKTAPASEDYSGGFLNTLMLKDLNLVSELALQSESSTPMGKLALQLYEEIKDQGFGTLDFSSIQKKYL